MFNVKKIPVKPLVAAMGAAFALSAIVAPLANAADNPFAVQELDSGHMVAGKLMADEGSCGEGEGSCGEGEGSCGEGEGSCGEGEGSCGEGEGSCGEGDDGEDEGEGKCGEGKCGDA
jgi:uncharacterized low-complexity protein